ncbi:hypothetical protein OsI_22739 [Oryza sativa Indica Group]|uniref:Uncharacterized protein n=1 Tax=Oryza sativa subsp. indica TaxID=39946 RepID=B8B144_ORYSI|nr:hypothetical protein OsI_22739 [Oryza sativa Indica Group]
MASAQRTSTVIGRTATAAAAGGVMFGRFSLQGYRSTDDYYDTLDAFLFYWPDTDTDAATTAVVVLPKVGGSGATLFNYARAAVRRRWAAHRAAADRRDGDVHGARLQRQCRRPPQHAVAFQAVVRKALHRLHLQLGDVPVDQAHSNIPRLRLEGVSREGECWSV